MYRDDLPPHPIPREWVTGELARLEAFAPTDPRYDEHLIAFWRKWLAADDDASPR